MVGRPWFLEQVLFPFNLEDKSPTVSYKSLRPISGTWLDRSTAASKYYPEGGARVAAWLRNRIPETKRDGGEESGSKRLGYLPWNFRVPHDMHEFSGVHILRFEEAAHQAWKKTGMGIVSTDIHFRGCDSMSAPLANIQSESVFTGTRGSRFSDRHGGHETVLYSGSATGSGSEAPSFLALEAGSFGSGGTGASQGARQVWWPEVESFWCTSGFFCGFYTTDHDHGSLPGHNGIDAVLSDQFYCSRRLSSKHSS
ncbi:hypothetical protein H4582DRAFT_2061137 [Lactarius indigo]|nr:hypothetical protein H4582DRAFT_2061137 [Lactarius indigo]